MELIVQLWVVVCLSGTCQEENYPAHFDSIAECLIKGPKLLQDGYIRDPVDEEPFLIQHRCVVTTGNPRVLRWATS